MLLVVAVIFPIIYGLILLFFKEIKRGLLTSYVGAGLAAQFVLSLFIVILHRAKNPLAGEFVFGAINRVLVLYLKLDDTGSIFLLTMMSVWMLAGFYSFEYMKHEEKNKRYFIFYLLTPGILAGLCTAGNLITYYFFYELMTISTFALVIHNRSKEAINAAFKYLMFSFAGAYMVLFGIFFTSRFCADPSIPFGVGDILIAPTDAIPLQYGNMYHMVMFLMIMGFSVKAGMFPMHSWLPTAHPVAPAPASAVLSGIIVKAGALGILRVIFNVFGPGAIRGTMAQKALITLTLITIFMGSMLAYREKVLKKRLAYSTVSQVSYILFGLLVCDTDGIGYSGAILHVLAHAFIKCVLFLTAGAIIYNTGCTKVDDLRGIGRKMPILIWCYTIASLGLIGIPPFGGFASKWYIAKGALLSQSAGTLGFFGVAILLISALLTAGYLLPITINAFLPGKDFTDENITSDPSNTERIYAPAYLMGREPKAIMLVPVIILTVISVIIGMFPGVIIK